jgi:hypothetical protein
METRSSSPCGLSSRRDPLEGPVQRILRALPIAKELAKLSGLAVGW